MRAGQLLSMDRKLQILIVAGIILTILLLFINIYAAGIVFVLLVAIAMSLMIMQDSTALPDIVGELSDDAKAVIIRNSGNAMAMKIHVALVPINVEFDLPFLDVEATHLHPVGQMIEEVKVVIRFENEQGTTFSRTYRLSSLGDGFEPLKPMMPLFGWK
jgi:hypothetical protein